MSLNNYQNAPYENSSPLQLLIYLTVGCATFIALIIADALGWPATQTVLLAAGIFTLLRACKKMVLVLTIHGKLDAKRRISEGQLKKQLRKIADVYFSMLLLSLFCYGVGVVLHIIYHWIY